ncbi:DUF2165 family protein [Pseudomonas koreensis]|uniref:DUF2165 family protein n=1 Tax=Pseudomonas koreensis TaxID=198620 RepID=UPI003D6EFB23
MTEKTNDESDNSSIDSKKQSSNSSHGGCFGHTDRLQQCNRLQLQLYLPWPYPQHGHDRQSFDISLHQLGNHASPDLLDDHDTRDDFYFCLLGGYQLAKNINSSEQQFHEAKKYAVLGFLVALFVYYFCLQVVGNEWFDMDQSKEWNAMSWAQSIVDFLLPALIFLVMKIDN